MLWRVARRADGRCACAGRDAGTFRRFEDRIGGRVFDAVSQYANFVPSHDMDDIKGMRKKCAPLPLLPRPLCWHCPLHPAITPSAPPCTYCHQLPYVTVMVTVADVRVLTQQ